MFHLAYPTPLFAFTQRAPQFDLSFRLPPQRGKGNPARNVLCNPIIFLIYNYLEGRSPLRYAVHPRAATPRRREERRRRKYHQAAPTPLYAYTQRAPQYDQSLRPPPQRYSRSEVFFWPVCSASAKPVLELALTSVGSCSHGKCLSHPSFEIYFQLLSVPGNIKFTFV